MSKTLKDVLKAAKSETGINHAVLSKLTKETLSILNVVSVSKLTDESRYDRRPEIRVHQHSETFILLTREGH